MGFIRFRHHHLRNGSTLSVCTDLDKTTRIVRVGWALCFHEDEWVRKIGNSKALQRMNDHETEMKFVISESEPIMSDYITLRALQLILISYGKKEDKSTRGNPKILSIETIGQIQREIVAILDNLGRRLGLEPIWIY